eukprot:5400697-Alexandrium_andersonii.AAC.1
MAYADNGTHVGLSRDKVDAESLAVQRRLNEVGLETHEESEASTTAVVLGSDFNGVSGVSRPSKERRA